MGGIVCAGACDRVVYFKTHSIMKKPYRDWSHDDEDAPAGWPILWLAVFALVAGIAVYFLMP